jgi:hypothetical protein
MSALRNPSMSLTDQFPRRSRVASCAGIACLAVSPFVQIVAGGGGAGSVYILVREGLRGAQLAETSPLRWAFRISMLLTIATIGYLVHELWCGGSRRIWRVFGAVAALGAWAIPVLLSEGAYRAIPAATGIFGISAFVIIVSGFRSRWMHDPDKCRSCGYLMRASGSATCPECGALEPASNEAASKPTPP